MMLMFLLKKDHPARRKDCNTILSILSSPVDNAKVLFKYKIVYKVVQVEMFKLNILKLVTNMFKKQSLNFK